MALTFWTWLFLSVFQRPYKNCDSVKNYHKTIVVQEYLNAVLVAACSDSDLLFSGSLQGP